jgi:predicted LPLAT superfamily acyltransferase
MRNFFYKMITSLSRKMGLWVFQLFAWFVATGYFIVFPGRVRNSIGIYRAVFPDRRSWFHLWCAWRQFHNFTHVYQDRFVLQGSKKLTFTSHGMQHLEAAVAKGTGGILLMSHMGNWEVAAHVLKRKMKDLRLMLYMGIREKEQIERQQKEALVKSGIHIIAVEKNGGSPMDLVEGIRFIESGGMVSMTGDLVWKTEQRTVPVQFLGEEILLPEVPHVLALLSGAPIFTFFAFRAARNQYQFTISAPVYVQAATRTARNAAVRQSAQTYAQALEAALRRYPLQWYHFRPFYKPENIH